MLMRSTRYTCIWCKHNTTRYEVCCKVRQRLSPIDRGSVDDSRDRVLLKYRVPIVPTAEIADSSRVPRIPVAEMTESSRVPRVPEAGMAESSRFPRVPEAD